ncbi:CLUMA_CG014814, isoform A [Clunio marinus]|uniref:CLUMA_CG014814, isoform A n=1 Tax=Clunio marinus TaxID=568069 RepID=A0A1J1IN76_9DIPT|nr:CLUMA_CG014814, isoform A [Clunio marinus]
MSLKTIPGRRKSYANKRKDFILFFLVKRKRLFDVDLSSSKAFCSSFQFYYKRLAAKTIFLNEHKFH